MHCVCECVGINSILYLNFERVPIHKKLREKAGEMSVLFIWIYIYTCTHAPHI